jgi:hypothetical protein
MINESSNGKSNPKDVPLDDLFHRTLKVEKVTH